MSDSIVVTATPASPDLHVLVDLLGPHLTELIDQLQAFRRQPPTPERTYAFEQKVAAVLRFRACRCSSRRMRRSLRSI